MSRRPLGGRCAAAITAGILFAAGCAGSQQQQRPSAAEQVPQLAVVLDRVDAALAAHRFGAARQQLKNLKAEVIEARDAGELRTADAERVLAAISRLLALLPASPAPSDAPEPESPSTAASKASGPGPSRPEHPESTVVRPSNSPASSPTSSPTPSTSESPSPRPSPSPTSPSLSPTPDETPMDSATREATPTGSPSPAP
jgi:hypothetical protein